MTATTSNRMPEPAHGHAEPTPHHRVPLVWIFAWLVFLTFVTVGVAMHRFQSELVNVLLALLVASIKGSLVALFFMHLKWEGKLIYLIFFVPLGLCVLLVVALVPDILMTESGSDSASMHDFNPPPAWSNQHVGH